MADSFIEALVSRLEGPWVLAYYGGILQWIELVNSSPTGCSLHMIWISTCKTVRFFCILVVLFPFARIGELHVNSMFGTWPELQFLTWQVPSGKNVHNYANVDLICLLSFLQIESGPNGSSGPNSSDFLNSFSPCINSVVIRLDLVFARSHCTGTTSGCSLAWMGVQLLAILRSEVTQNKPAITLPVVLSIFGDESLVGRLVLDITTVKRWRLAWLAFGPLACAIKEWGEQDISLRLKAAVTASPHCGRILLEI